MKKNPTTIDEFLDQFSEEQRKTLQKLRQVIHKLVPDAEECINYGVACFRLNNKSLIGFSAGKNHCSLYPMDGSTTAKLKADLVKYKTSKGAIQFSSSKMLPSALVKKIIMYRKACLKG